MKRSRNIMRYSVLWTLLFCAALPLPASNTVVTVSQVTSSVTVNTAEDYTVTSATPFTTAGSVNLTSENAVLILKSVIPSKTLSTYISNIYINGSTAVNGTNCTVSIYNAGTIILPYKVSSKGLTVYTGANFTGKSATYTPGSITTLTGDFNLSIKSFKLKRGYMAMLSVSNSFNKVWVASDGDLEVSTLPAAFSGKITQLRVLRWQWPNKKGYAGTDMTANGLLNTTSFYGWNASDYSRTDREYVPQHHHEGWPAISAVTGHNDCTAILGNNEPDNTSSSKEHPATVSQVLANWPQMMAGGQRLGSPAVSGKYDSWLYPFIDSIDAKGYRCDFVTVHAYWNSSPTNFMSSLKAIYNRTKRPLWITEFNYGANWTTETWPTSDRSISTNNYEHERAWMAELIPLLDAAPYVERYFIYNWVQDCRMVYVSVSNHTKCTGGCTAAKKAEDAARITAIKSAGGKYVKTVNDTLEYYITPAGNAYANTTTSQLAYTGAYDITPSFKYQPPYSLAYTYTSATQTVNLTWKNYNGIQTDNTSVERSYNDGDFISVGTISSTATTSQSFNDVLQNLPAGVYVYRIHNHDSDGAERYSSTVVVIKGTDITSTYIANPSFEYSAAGTKLSAPFKTSNTADAGIYGWTQTLANTNYVDIQVMDAATDNASLYGKRVNPDDGTYYYFYRHGWANTGVLVDKLTTTTLATLPAGVYTLCCKFKGAEAYSNDTEHYGKGSTLQLSVIENGTTLGTGTTASEVFKSYIYNSAVTYTYFNTVGWTTLYRIFKVSTPGVVNFVFQTNAKGGVRTDLCLDNVRIYSIPPTIILDENSDYTPAENQNVNVKLIRSLKVGHWNTLCLPFGVTNSDIATVFGTGAQVANFTGVTLNDNSSSTLNFTTVNAAIEANEPCLIKVTTAPGSYILPNVSLTANGVSDIVQTGTNSSLNQKVTATMIGTYSNITVPTPDSYIISSDKFYFVDGAVTLKPFRAYFKVPALTANAKALNVNVDGQTTAVEGINADDNGSCGNVYNLSGQLVRKNANTLGGLTKGVYIINGKKMVVK